MTDLNMQQGGVSNEELLELVKLFDGFSQASTTFSQSYRMLEQRITLLQHQLQEQAEVLLRTQSFLTSVLENTPAGIIVVNMKGEIRLFNSEAERLTGLDADHVRGKRYHEVFDYPITEPLSAIFTLNNGTLIGNREKELIQREGKTLPVRFSTSWVHNAEGERMGVLEVFEDLRDFRDLQQKIQRKNNLASLGEMAAQVAHELRNPLAGVLGFAQFMLEDLPEDNSTRPYAERIVSGVRDIDFIASRLLEFTHPVNPQFEKVDLIRLIEDEVELIRTEANTQDRQEGEVQITVSLPDENVPVTCDPLLIKQVLLNILKNALIAVDGSGKIHTSLRWDMFKNRVFIRVKDTGIGIDAENLSKIFNPFFTTRSKGTGLGLSMVKKTIDVHDGEIVVESTRGEGSMFSIELMITRYS
ncbi:PAS domain S-box protein [bacterium]|nr:PAS domain S-box protein [bacterium]